MNIADEDVTADLAAAPDNPNLDPENFELIRQGLNHISDQCRQLLLYYYFEERSMTNIAEMMGFANDKVAKSKKYQCKKKLEAVVAQLTAQEKAGP